MSLYPVKPHPGPVTSGVGIPPVLPHKRIKGNGINLILFRNMKSGESIWEVPRKKMESIRQSALKGGIKISVRKIPSGRYAVFKL